MEIGEDLPESRLDDRLKRLAINHCCTLVYNSPESGSGPRGVMLSHDNLTWCSKMVSKEAKPVLVVKNVQRADYVDVLFAAFCSLAFMKCIEFDLSFSASSARPASTAFPLPARRSC